MSKPVKFYINSKIEIIWNDVAYKSDIQNVTENYIAISIPLKNGSYIPLRRDEKITALYYINGDIYKFTSTVIGRAREVIPVIYIEIPSDVKKVQRRNHVRVPLIADITCALINKDKKLINLNSKQVDIFNAFTLDLSGGGTKIVTKRKLEVGDKLLINIKLDEEIFALQGEIIRVEKNKDNQYVCGISFVDLENKTTERIIRVVFQLMRDQVKRTSKEE